MTETSPPNKQKFFRRFFQKRTTCLLLCLGAVQARAADLGSVEGFDVRLDTSARVSLGLRAASQDPALLGVVNADDGDRAFRAGLISERLDLSSTLDVTRGDLGAELSADGWYDAAYHGQNDDRSAATFNPVTVPVGRFAPDVRRLMGGTVELGRAYVHDRLELAGLPVTIRIGRQTLLWGESLFFAQDGIAGAQAPVDLIKQASQPLIAAHEIYLPVTQADVSLRLAQGLSLEAYDQLEWRRDRLPGVGSFFSTTDILDTGGQRVLAPGSASLFRGRDDTPSGAGRFGVAVRLDRDAIGLGLYALRTDATSPQAERVSMTTYRLAYPRGIELLGASISTYAGDDIVSGEISARRHAPLASRFDLLAPAAGEGSTAPAAYDLTDRHAATGRTLEALASYDRLLSPGRWWNGGALQAELAATDLLGVDAGSAGLLPRTTRFALSFQAVFTPTYYHVRRDLDVSMPVGFEIGVAGRSSVDPGRDAGTGNFTIGIAATYRVVWDLGLSFSHFLGTAASQPLADRDFVTLSVSRTF